VSDLPELPPAEAETRAKPDTSRLPWGVRLVPLAVASALMMEMLDATALSTALPTLSREFMVEPVHLKFALTSYIMALAVAAPASGWVAQRWGPKRVFCIAMVVFLLGSALCGFSRSLPALIASRVVQGIGGAMMTPVGRLILVSATPKERFVAAMAWFSMPALIGPLLGPPLAGFIIEWASWPWIFFVNIPFGILGIAAVTAFVPRLEEAHPGRFDIKGFLLAGAAVISLVVLADTIGAGLIPLWSQFALAAVSALFGAAFVRHSFRRPDPVLDLRLLAFPTFRAAMLGGNLVRMGLGATPFLMPLLLQVALGWSPVKAATVTIFTAVGIFAMKPLAAPILKRFGYRTTLICAGVLAAFGAAAPAAFGAWMPPVVMMAILAWSGFVRSMHFTAANTLGYADVPRERVARAATLLAVTQQIGMSLGITVGALALHLTTLGGGPLTADRFVFPFLLIGAISLLAVPVYARLPRDAGQSISGRS
jgi:EmrB/QacA subfamily drug resistance transporter